MSLNKVNFLKTLWMASVMIVWTQSCNLHKNLSSGRTYNNGKEKAEEEYSELVKKLSKEYSKSTDGWVYYGKNIVDWGKTQGFHSESWEPIEAHGKMEDFYSERFHSISWKGDSLIHHTGTEWDFFSKRDLFYQQILAWNGKEPYGLIVKFLWESREQTYKIYDTIETNEFDEIINKAEKFPSRLVEEDPYFNTQNNWKNNFKVYTAERAQEEKILWLLPEYYYEKIKGREFETHWTLLDKPSENVFKLADKHWFVLKPKILVLRNMNSYENSGPIKLRGIYIWIPEEKIQNALRPKDTIPTITKEEVKIQEEKMNEIFDYGQKEIFMSSSTNFKNEGVKQSLDDLYKILDENKSLNIVVTWYYGGKHPTLPKQRAEAVKKYLIAKWIESKRIETVWGTESVARSIQIKIVTDEK